MPSYLVFEIFENCDYIPKYSLQFLLEFTGMNPKNHLDNLSCLSQYW
jgi:hypothetical protein